MKIKAILAAAFCIAAVSCTKDDVKLPSKEFTGEQFTLVGELTGEETAAPASYTLLQQTDGKATLSVPASGSGMMAQPAFEVKDIEVKEIEGGYSFFRAPFIQKINEKNYKFTEGIRGTLKGEKLTLKYSFMPGKMPMAIHQYFNLPAPDAVAYAIEGAYIGKNTYAPVEMSVTKQPAMPDQDANVYLYIRDYNAAAKTATFEFPLTRECVVAGVAVEKTETGFNFKIAEDTTNENYIILASSKGAIVSTGNAQNLTFEYTSKSKRAPMVLKYNFSGHLVGIMDNEL